jgi:hypothetical protein
MELDPQTVNLILIIPKLIEAFIFLILVILLTKRLLAKPVDKRYILNKLFIGSFIAWSIYMICDAILYNLAGVPFLDMTGDILIENQVTGYPSEYSEVLISQVLRDIAMVFAFLMCYGYLASASVIKKGEKWTKEHLFKNWLFNIPLWVIVIFLIVGDQIGVTKDGDNVWVKEKWGSMEGALSMIIIIAILLTSAIIFFRVVLSMEDVSPEFKKRTRQIGAGIMLMAVGGIYWIVLGVATSDPANPLPIITHTILTFVGHAIWMISPILIYLGLKNQ